MYLKKCPYCQSSNVKKNGLRNHIQHYKCRCCGKQFLNKPLRPSCEVVWQEYFVAKQTTAQIAAKHQMSTSTIRRILSKKEILWAQPDLSQMSGYVHLDATYWGHNSGLLLAIDDATGKALYMEFIKSETTKSYTDAVDMIESAGYLVKGIIIDGKHDLFAAFKDYPVQMCQFHMLQIVRRYLTGNPKMKASIALMLLMRNMKHLSKEDFTTQYAEWKEQYKEFLNKRVTHKNGKTYYLHRRLRTLVHSIDFYQPYLFTCQSENCVGMPNTNNKIEGTFTDLKGNLNNHSGLSIEHRKRFIIEYLQTKH